MSRGNMNQPEERRFNLWACWMALLVFGLTWYGVYEMTIEYLGASNGFAATSGILLGFAVGMAAYEVLRRLHDKVNSRR